MDENRVRQIFQEEIAFFAKNDKYIFDRLVVLNDGRNFQFGRGTGTKLGTAADQKLGLYGVTPVAQQAAISAPSGGATVDNEARSAINSLRTALALVGITL